MISLLEILGHYPKLKENVLKELTEHKNWVDKCLLSPRDFINLLNQKDLFKCSNNKGKLFNWKWCPHCKKISALELLGAHDEGNL